MSDEKLRRDLIALGYTPGPITDTTRKLLEKKLQKLRDGAKKSRNSTSNARRSRRQDPRDDSEEEEEEDGEEEYLPLRRGTVQEDSRRGDNRRNLRASTEESNCLLGDKSQRSSLSYNRYTSDTLEPERSSLSYNRYPSDTLEPERSSLSYNRYPSDTLEPERSSLSYNRYPSDTQERRSLGYNSSNLGRSSLSNIRYSLGSPECKRSSVGYGSFLSTSPERSSHGDNRSSEEVRYRSLGDRSRGYSTSTYISSSRPAPDYLGHKAQLGLNLEKGSHFKPAWPKKLEYYLSRLLRVLCVILALVFTSILIAKSGILTSSQNYDLKLLPADCEGRQDSFCKAKQKKITLQILSELYDFLSLEAGNFECGNPSGLSSKCIPINRAKGHVMNVGGYSAEKFDSALDWMLSSDQHLGIWAKGEDAEELVTIRADVFCVESSQPRLGFVCRLKNALYTAISNLFMALIGIFILWIILIFLRYHWQELEEEEKQMFAMVEKIIDVVKHQHIDWTLRKEQDPYIGILHVRDSLIMPKDRKRLRKVWDRSVKFVEDNESRVRTESHRIAGADLMVWRWTEARNKYPR